MDGMYSVQGEPQKPQRVFADWPMSIYHEFYEMESTSRSVAENRDRQCSLLLQQKRKLEHQLQEAQEELIAQKEVASAQEKQIRTRGAKAPPQSTAVPLDDDGCSHDDGGTETSHAAPTPDQRDPASTPDEITASNKGLSI
ncbi:hypothetical protein NLG97_g1918 [Lecanicillium saksenae]|uniref:Uncharacterized protein n=1 Tax=Lecanicillium saksenae TaxID=468837 RepID=A0ACC1R2K9_9HYPO|nr:hypothetical protein NLG97_g1918 [Lecanicillium saksenae]